MNTMLRIGAATALALELTGCGHLPDAGVSYYLATSRVSFKVIRTFTCDADNHIRSASAVTPAVTHAADRSKEATKSVPLIKLRGSLSDADLKFEYYDDGRLKAFNGSSTGEGEGILKTVITIAGAVFAFDGGEKRFPKECAEIKKLAGDKGLALTYSGEVDPEETRDQPIPPDATSLIIVSEHKLQGAIGYVCASVTGTDRPSPRVAYEKKDGEVVLDLREPALLHVKISAGGENSCQSETIWDDSVVVAQLGTPYSLPLPPPTTFGKRALAATFSESGALTLAQFTSNTGVGQGLNVVNSALAATKGTTAAEKAAELKAEADVIAQTQRLAQCLADPKSCK